MPRRAKQNRTKTRDRHEDVNALLEYLIEELSRAGVLIGEDRFPNHLRLGAVRACVIWADGHQVGSTGVDKLFLRIPQSGERGRRLAEYVRDTIRSEMSANFRRVVVINDGAGLGIMAYPRGRV